MCLASAAHASTTSFPAGSTCHANVATDIEYADLADDPAAWRCDGSNWSIDKPRSLIRIDLTDGRNPADYVLQTRLTRFASMQIALLDRDGSVASRTLDEDGFEPGTFDWLMSTALPEINATASALVITVDEPRHPGLVSALELVPKSPDLAEAFRHELLLAGLCGILCVPLIFNFAFYRVLRETFVLWHALAVVFMLVQTVVTSGLINRFADLSIEQLSVLSATSWGGGLIAAALFSINLIEPGKLDPIHRNLMRGLAVWIPGWTLLYLYGSGPLRPWSATLYFGSYLPVLALFIWVIVVAWSRGSRAVYFQIAAWTPIMLTGAVRIVSAMGFTDAPLELQLQQHLAIGFEVLITSLGVADRFMVIKRQRDRAREQSRTFEELAERDPLTGLLNRRVIEERFPDLHERGFRTMAVIDL
ncbi:MAG: diguanylate cyclase, partial [Novosphingobium sp.]|nr:diguanylate cyclase [Novosphingobium sp.]